MASLRKMLQHSGTDFVSIDHKVINMDILRKESLFLKDPNLKRLLEKSKHQHALYDAILTHLRKKYSDKVANQLITVAEQDDLRMIQQKLMDASNRARGSSQPSLYLTPQQREAAEEAAAKALAQAKDGER